MNRLIYMAVAQDLAEKRLKMAQINRALLIAEGYWGTVWLATLSGGSLAFLHLAGYQTAPVMPYESIQGQIEELVGNAHINPADYL